MMSGRGRVRGKGKGCGAATEVQDLDTEELFSVCERSAEVHETDYEGIKGTDDENDDAEYLVSQVTFSVDHSILLIGIRFASEIYPNPINAESDNAAGDSYDEEAFIFLLEGDTELATTHIDDEVKFKSIIEANFSEAQKIDKNKTYKLKVMCNLDGAYPLANCSKKEVKNGVTFLFNVGKPEDSERDGMIRALIFKKL